MEIVLILAFIFLLISILLFISYFILSVKKVDKKAFVIFIGPIPIFGGDKDLAIIALIISIVLLLTFLIIFKI